MKLLIFSDIHGDKSALQTLMDTEADYYIAAGDLVNFNRGYEQIGPILERRGERVLVIPGNMEDEGGIDRFCSRYGLRNFHGQSMELEGTHVCALGYSNPTPFETPGEYSEDELREKLQPFSGLSPLVLICHAPPHGTKLDRVGGGQQVGSTAIRAFIETAAPLRFYCGHIHETAGMEDRIGPTLLCNVGKRGSLLDLQSLSTTR